jgi:hypothetical protein
MTTSDQASIESQPTPRVVLIVEDDEAIGTLLVQSINAEL